MRRLVETYNEIEGFHYWPNASGNEKYLSYKHRHIFTIRCRFWVSHNDREIEFNSRQNEIEDFLVNSFGRPCQFGAFSCESLAQAIMDYYGDCCISCTVLEDGNGGATLTR